MTSRFRALWRKTLRNENGTAAVEFALVAPLFVLILAAILEIGLVVRGRFALISAMSAATNHTLAIGSPTDATSAQHMAGTIASRLAGGGRSASVNVNNAVTAQLTGASVAFSNGDGGIANCYCPSVLGGGIAWGAATGCGAPCGDGSIAGAFVEISAQTPFTPILGAFRFLDDDALRDYSVVRLP